MQKHTSTIQQSKYMCILLSFLINYLNQSERNYHLPYRCIVMTQRIAVAVQTWNASSLLGTSRMVWLTSVVVICSWFCYNSYIVSCCSYVIFLSYCWLTTCMLLLFPCVIPFLVFVRLFCSCFLGVIPFLAFVFSINFENLNTRI